MWRFKDGSVANADGAQAFAKAKRKGKIAAEVPLQTVRHSNKKGQPKQFTKFQKYKVSELSQKLKAVAKRQKRLKRGSGSLRSTAGTQGVEGGVWSALKAELRKQNCLGRGTVSNSTVNGLAATFVLLTPGLEALGKAMKLHFDEFKDEKESWDFFG